MRHQEINRVVVLTNPASTRHNAIQPQIDELSEFFGSQLREVKSYPRPIDTTDMLKDELKERDVIVTVGGDGTARTAVEALSDPNVSAHQSTLLPLPGGHRNDLARQLHGKQYFGRPSNLIRSLNVAEILPLQTTITCGDEQYRRISALYTGLGAMAAAANHISSAEFRARRGYSNVVLRELYSIGALPWTFTHTDATAVCDDEGVNRTLYDAMLVNGSVVAEHLHPPVSLVENRAFYTELKSRSPRDVVPYMARLMAQPYVKPPAHRMVTPGEEVGFTLLEPAYIHTDGDVELLKAGQHVSFGLYTTTFRALCAQMPRTGLAPGQLCDNSLSI